jgi:hypothetical protein
MARMTIDRSAQERVVNALRAATASYSDALRAVDKARLVQRAAIIDARSADVRQVDVTTLTVTPERPKGFTREHIRRIEEDFRRRRAWGLSQGLDVDQMETADILQIPLPEESDNPGRHILDDDTADDDTADDDAADDDENAEVPAGVMA